MRKNNYDTLKGILIFLVVFAHMLLIYDYYPKDSCNIVISSIYSFHMPLFFIISGYFSKKIKKERIINYLALFLFMNTSFLLFDYLKYGNIDIFVIKYSSWFILLIAIYRLLVSNKKISNLLLKRYSLLIVFVLSIVSGFFIRNYLLVRLVTFFYFFVLGYRKKFSIDKKYNYVLLVVSVLMLGTTIYFYPVVDFYMGLSYSYSFEAIIRIFVFIADTMLFVSVIGLIKNKKVPVITELGKNCLYIYVLHRIPTLILGYKYYSSNKFIIISLLLSILLCLLINSLSKYIEKLFQTRILLIMSIIFIGIPILLYNSNHELDGATQDKLDNSISIGFLGDLILLEDQLKLSNNNFDYMFNNTKKYIQDTDYVFGVLEGPVDDEAEYSYGNFDDGKMLRVNYPTTFLRSIENAGIDFVTISNNHLLDRGINSYKNTITNLNNSNLDYTGTSNNYKIIDIEGMKVGVLAYTYGLNYIEDEEYFKCTNFLTEPYSEDFEKVKRNIHADFTMLKNSNVDLIIVMPHYGTQFSHRIDSYQEVWNRFFINEGANIILGDHSHAIQPIQYKKNSIIVNSPGNYINSYIGYDGDLSMYVKIFIDKDTHKINGSSVTPIIATEDKDGKYYPVLLKDTTTENQERIKTLFGGAIFNNKIKDIKNTYYYLPNDSYKYDNKYKLKLNNDDKNSLVYQKILEHNKICFIGDSITEGSLNGYKPWYLPLMSYFDKEVVNISKSSYTSYDVLEQFSDKIKNSNCGLNIINIGTNDIRYNAEDINNYINNINKIIELTNGEVILLAPWQTTDKDYNIDKDDKVKRKLYSTYNEELKKINNIYYIDPNPYIKEVIKYNGEDEYILDGVHPNNKIGIKLYSFAVLRGNNN